MISSVPAAPVLPTMAPLRPAAVHADRPAAVVEPVAEVAVVVDEGADVIGAEVEGVDGDRVVEV